MRDKKTDPIGSVLLSTLSYFLRLTLLAVSLFMARLKLALARSVEDQVSPIQG